MNKNAKSSIKSHPLTPSRPNNSPSTSQRITPTKATLSKNISIDRQSPGPTSPPLNTTNPAITTKPFNHIKRKGNLPFLQILVFKITMEGKSKVLIKTNTKQTIDRKTATGEEGTSHQGNTKGSIGGENRMNSIPLEDQGGGEEILGKGYREVDTMETQENLQEKAMGKRIIQESNIKNK